MITVTLLPKQYNKKHCCWENYARVAGKKTLMHSRTYAFIKCFAGKENSIKAGLNGDEDYEESVTFTANNHTNNFAVLGLPSIRLCQAKVRKIFDLPPSDLTFTLYYKKNYKKRRV